MKLDYDLLIAETPLPRQERINIGLIVWRDAMPELRVETSARRLATLDPNWPRLPIFRQLLEGTLGEALRQHLCALPDVAARRTMLSFLLSPMKALPGGELFADEHGDFASAIDRAMHTLVGLPTITIKQERAPQRRSKLEVELRAWLRSANLLGRNMQDLSKSRVVSQFPVAVDADVYADFAYKNGALHVIETLDLRGVDHVTHSLRNTAAFKSLTLDMAREVVGSKGRRLGVVAASDYGAVRGALKLFERNADEVFSLDNPKDAQRLADLLADSLHLDGGLLPVTLLD